MVYVVDTHALVWYLTADKKLGKKAKAVLLEGEMGNVDLIIPTIVFFEILTLTEKKRITIKWKEFFSAISEFPRAVYYPLGVDVLLEMVQVDKSLELHDRMIIATARIHKAPLITRDEKIRKSKEVSIIW